MNPPTKLVQHLYSEPIPVRGPQCVTLGYRQSRPAIMVCVYACLYSSELNQNPRHILFEMFIKLQVPPHPACKKKYVQGTQQRINSIMSIDSCQRPSSHVKISWFSTRVLSPQGTFGPGNQRHLEAGAPLSGEASLAQSPRAR